MRRSIFVLAVVFALISTKAVSGQGRPEWIGKLEETLTQKERAWKIDDKLVNDEPGAAYGESFRLKKGAFTGSLQVQVYYILENPDETFTGLVTARDNIGGKRLKKTKLEGLGTEAYMWTSSNADDYTSVIFKKGKIFVTVFLPGRTTAQRFAKHAAAHIP